MNLEPVLDLIKLAVPSDNSCFTHSGFALSPVGHFALAFRLLRSHAFQALCSWTFKKKRISSSQFIRENHLVCDPTLNCLKRIEMQKQYFYDALRVAQSTSGKAQPYLLCIIQKVPRSVGLWGIHTNIHAELYYWYNSESSWKIKSWRSRYHECDWLRSCL